VEQLQALSARFSEFEKTVLARLDAIEHDIAALKRRA
jgi:hypothetical protein